MHWYFCYTFLTNITFLEDAGLLGCCTLSTLRTKALQSFRTLVTANLHITKSYKAGIFSYTTVRTWNLTWLFLCVKSHYNQWGQTAFISHCDAVWKQCLTYIFFINFKAVLFKSPYSIYLVHNCTSCSIEYNIWRVFLLLDWALQSG